MEPTNLNSPPPDELDALLRHASRADPLPDHGFSARVLAALPPARASVRRRDPRRLVFCAIGGLAGIMVAILNSGSWSEISAGLTSTGPQLSQAFAQLTSPGFGLAVAVTLVSLAFVFRPQGRLLR